MAKQLQLTNQDFEDLTFQKAPPKLASVLDVATGHYKVPKRQIMLSYFNLDTFKFVDIDDDADYRECLKEKSSSIVIAVQLPGQISKFTIPAQFQGDYMNVLKSRQKTLKSRQASQSPSRSVTPTLEELQIEQKIRLASKKSIRTTKLDKTPSHTPEPSFTPPPQPSPAPPRKKPTKAAAPPKKVAQESPEPLITAANTPTPQPIKSKPKIAGKPVPQQENKAKQAEDPAPEAVHTSSPAKFRQMAKRKSNPQNSIKATPNVDASPPAKPTASVQLKPNNARAILAREGISIPNPPSPPNKIKSPPNEEKSPSKKPKAPPIQSQPTESAKAILAKEGIAIPNKDLLPRKKSIPSPTLSKPKVPLPIPKAQETEKLDGVILQPANTTKKGGQGSAISVKKPTQEPNKESVEAVDSPKEEAKATPKFQSSAVPPQSTNPPESPEVEPVQDKSPQRYKRPSNVPALPLEKKKMPLRAPKVETPESPVQIAPEPPFEIQPPIKEKKPAPPREATQETPPREATPPSPPREATPPSPPREATPPLPPREMTPEPPQEQLIKPPSAVPRPIRQEQPFSVPEKTLPPREKTPEPRGENVLGPPRSDIPMPLMRGATLDSPGNTLPEPPEDTNIEVIEEKPLSPEEEKLDKPVRQTSKFATHQPTSLAPLDSDDESEEENTPANENEEEKSPPNEIEVEIDEISPELPEEKGPVGLEVIQEDPEEKSPDLLTPKDEFPNQQSDALDSLPSQSSLSQDQFNSIQLREISKSKEDASRSMTPIVPKSEKSEDDMMSIRSDTTQAQKRVRVREAMCLLEAFGYEELEMAHAKNLLRHAYPGNHPNPILQGLQKTGFIDTEKGISIKLLRKSFEKLKEDQILAINEAALAVFTFMEDEVDTYATSEANYNFASRVIENPVLKIQSDFRLDLLIRLGEYKYHMLGRPEDAVNCFEQAVDLASTIYPDLKSNSKLAYAHENLAKCYITTMKLSQCELSVKKALEIKVNLYGKEHPETATAFHYLGNLALAQRRLEEAVEWHEKAVQMRSDKIGPDSVEVSYSLGMLASDYLELKNLEKAYDLQMKAKKIRKEKLSPDHPKLADIYFNLSSTWLAMGDLELAEKYIVHSYQIRLQVFGDNHYSVAACRVNIAQIFLTTEKYKEAMTAIQLAIKSFKSQFGENHPYCKAAMIVRRRLETKYDELGLPKNYVQQGEIEIPKIHKTKRSACCEIF